jgi:uncharacterized protein
MGEATEVVQRAMAAVVTGDAGSAAALVADDFVWHIPGDSAVGGDVSGAAGWIEKMHRLLSKGLIPQPLAWLEGSDLVAVLQRNQASNEGRTLDVRVVNLYRVEEGKVRRLDTFFEDQHAVEEFWNDVLS